LLSQHLINDLEATALEYTEEEQNDNF
jgi:hypothetical protein